MNAPGDAVRRAGAAAHTAAVEDALAALEGGALVLVPTDTVFGLSADAHNGAAVQRLYALKGRPADQPVSLLVANAAMARTYGVLDDRAQALAARFWPGALTLVVPVRDGAPHCGQLTGGTGRIGLRVPAQAQTRALIGRLGRALAVSSANSAGAAAPLRASDIAPAIAAGAALRLAGQGGGSGASTVLEMAPDGVRVLRRGALGGAALAPGLACFGAPGRLR